MGECNGKREDAMGQGKMWWEKGGCYCKVDAAMGNGRMHWKMVGCNVKGKDAMGKGRMQWKGDDAVEKWRMQWKRGGWNCKGDAAMGKGGCNGNLKREGWIYNQDWDKYITGEIYKQWMSNMRRITLLSIICIYYTLKNSS